MGSVNFRGIDARNHRPRCRKSLARLVCGATLLSSSVAWAQESPPVEPAATGEAEVPAATSEPTSPEPNAAAEPSGPHTANSLQLGIGFRYGVMLNDGDLNPWASGLGLSAGYTLPNAIYLGANFEYFFGSKSELLGRELSANLWQLSAEGGYDLGLGENFVIRPKVGVGVAGVHSEIEGCTGDEACPSASTTKPAIAPGATFMLFTSKVSLALDVRYNVVLTDPTLKGLIFSFGVGF